MNTPKKIKLKVIFDTSIIYSLSETHLLNIKTQDFIKKFNKLEHFELEFILPKMVVDERKFQMIKESKKLKASSKKLESLTNVKITLTDESISDFVSTNISNQIKNKSIKIAKPNLSKIEWKSIVNSSANRFAPFEDVDKNEKGFRDAIILETSVQIVNKLLKPSSNYRIVFVSADEVLNSSFSQRTSSHKNEDIYIENSLESLEELINTFTSNIDEQVVQKLKDQFVDLFFTEGDKEGLYYSFDVRNKIRTNFKSVLTQDKDFLTTKIEEGTWYISPIAFVSKKSNEIIWKSKIIVKLEASKNNYLFDNITYPATGITSFGNTQSVNLDPNKFLVTDKVISQRLQISGTPINNDWEVSMPSAKEEKYKKGEAIFYVFWKVKTNLKFKTSKPEFIKVEHIETNWEPIIGPLSYIIPR